MPNRVEIPQFLIDRPHFRCFDRPGFSYPSDWGNVTTTAANIAPSESYGVVIPSTALIIDVDPRNGGEKSLPLLERDLGFSAAEIAQLIVRTGSGGTHYYLGATWGGFPPEMESRTKIDEYPGIDFLRCQPTGKVKNVTGPGSYPDRSKNQTMMYEVIAEQSGGPIPQALIDLLAYKTRRAERPEGVNVEQEIEYARQCLLRAPEGSAESYDDWIKIGYACKFVGGDDLFDPWAKWSDRCGGDSFQGVEDCWDTWESFQPDGSIGLGSLLYLAGVKHTSQLATPEDYFGPPVPPSPDAEPPESLPDKQPERSIEIVRRLIDNHSIEVIDGPKDSGKDGAGKKWQIKHDGRPVEVCVRVNGTTTATCSDPGYSINWEQLVAYYIPELKKEKPAPPAPQDGKPQIDVHNVTDHYMVDVSAEQLAKRGSDDNFTERIFCRNKSLVQIHEDLSINEMDTYLVRYSISRCVDFIAETRSGWRVARVPEGVANQVCSLGKWANIPELTAVSNIPVLRSDGSLWQTRGYDERTGVFYWPTVDVGEISEAPTLDQARAAYEYIADVYRDFPFSGHNVSGSNRVPLDDDYLAAAIAYPMTMIARTAVKGNVPVFTFSANNSRSGKTLAIKLSVRIATGEKPSFTSFVRGEEQRKTVNAIVMEAWPYCVFDNLNGPFGGDPLDAVTTASAFSGRGLGGNKTFRLPVNTVFAVTGNNISYCGDIGGRTVPVEMETDMEDPSKRPASDFKYPRPLQFIEQSRGTFVRAFLVILRAFIAAGQPNQHLGEFGGFEEWVKLIPGAIHWACGGNCLANREQLKKVDENAALLPRVINAIAEAIESGSEGITTAQLIGKTFGNAELTALLSELAWGRKPDKESAAIGRKIGTLANKWCGGRRIVKRVAHGGATLWCIETR